MPEPANKVGLSTLLSHFEDGLGRGGDPDASAQVAAVRMRYSQGELGYTSALHELQGAILPHGRIYRHTLCLGALSPGSRNFIISPMPWPNFIMFAVPSSSQRVLQLWSNRTWSTWLLFWSRKWPPEASNHHFFPLRGLCADCALPGAEEIFIDLGGRRAKNADF